MTEITCPKKLREKISKLREATIIGRPPTERERKTRTFDYIKNRDVNNAIHIDDDEERTYLHRYINKGTKIRPPKPTQADRIKSLKAKIEERKLDLDHNHKIVFRFAKSESYDIPNLQSGGSFWKYWLLNAKKVNGNGWGVSDKTIHQNIARFIGRPFVVTAKEWIENSEYGAQYEHPYVPTNHLPTIFNHQAKFTVGIIKDVYKDSNDDFYATIEPLPKFAQRTPPPFCSPAIFQLDPHEPENAISKWEALHLAGLDRDPAYGAAIAMLKGTCIGTANECSVQFHGAKQQKTAAYKIATPAEVKIDPEHGLQIADAYDQMKHEPNKPEVKEAYDALINETGEQFKQLIKGGLKITKLKSTDANPYPTSKHLHEDIEKNNHLYYFPTEQGFGQGENNKDHPMMRPTEFQHDGGPLLANDVFRIVHDVNGHHLGGKTSFGPKGEHQAFIQHSRMYSPIAKKALFTETAGQNNWVNFSRSHGEKNRANPKNTTFAEQKAGLLPDDIINGKFHI